MTDEKRKKANDIYTEMLEIECFLRTLKNNWRILTIIKPQKIDLYTGYGANSDRIRASTRLTERVIKAIEDELAQLKQEYEEL